MTPLQITSLILGYLFIGVILATLMYRDDRKHGLDDKESYGPIVVSWPFFAFIAVLFTLEELFKATTAQIGKAKISTRLILLFDKILPPWHKDSKEIDYIDELNDRINDIEDGNFVDYERAHDHILQMIEDRDDVLQDYIGAYEAYDDIYIGHDEDRHVEFPRYEVLGGLDEPNPEYDDLADDPDLRPF